MNDNVKEQFREKIENCYTEYQRQWMQLPAEDLIQKAEEIASIQLMAKQAPELVSEDQAEYLLKFKNPLEVVSDGWLAENGSDVSLIDEALDHALWRLIDTGDAETVYELEPVEQKQMEFGIFHIKENGSETYFASIGNHALLHTAEQLRGYVRGEDSASVFENLYPNRVEITEHEFERYVGERMEDSGRVTGAFDIDFDAGEFTGLRIMDGWQSFSIQDVCSAAHYAMQKEDADTEERWDRLLDQLQGKEITQANEYEFLRGDRPLRSEDISFCDGIFQQRNLLDFHVETNFNVAEVFGAWALRIKDEDFLHIDANYDLKGNCVCDTLTVILNCANGENGAYKYRLNAEEQAAMTQKMDTYCLEQVGASLDDLHEQYHIEDSQTIRIMSL